MEAYLLSDDQRSQLSRAKGLLIDGCMKKAGYDQWNPAPELPKMGPKTLTDWRYGIHDGELAKRRGYKPDDAEQAAYDEAVNLGAVDGTSPEGPDGKALQVCIGEARTKLGTGASSYGEEAQKLGNEAFTRSKEDPKVIAASQEWSSCMKEQGYNYKQPLDASDDSRFSGKEVTPEEIATATADITCRNRTHVAKIWWETEAKLQTASLEKNAETLEKARKELDASIKAVADVLAGEK
ncbi:hypothetical protein [Streptomyces sp. NRRL S-378]|uniref:hypothetical protein n=1 Tax=Streptomyces sp. NRRL S-378 TaxID=1463904 RepID=UPI001F431B0C|nr:hypothetical protein [Streptomyces sp. NRRL S-378]